ncbi:hypothetical protein [Erythrobacter sp. QSSC1-22B]|uniref:hypothetical protein n=1 Tax=Erythrobacter sp. QSSC1-22B TaxID=1860125 RepID=UPI0011A5EE3E|nr:hypothetical protein [Erythrobacter sp. QSSC1-22B]
MPVIEEEDDFDRLETKVYQVAIRQPAIEHRTDVNVLQNEVGNPVYTAEKSGASPPDASGEIDANEDVDAFDMSRRNGHGHPDDEDDEDEEVDFYAVAGIDRNQSDPQDDDREEEPLFDISPSGHSGTEPDPIEDAQTRCSTVDDEPIAAAGTLFSENDRAIERPLAPAWEQADDTPPNEMVGPLEDEHEHPEGIAVSPHLELDELSEGDQRNTPHPIGDARPARPVRFDPPSLSEVKDEDML